MYRETFLHRICFQIYWVNVKPEVWLSYKNNKEITQIFFPSLDTSLTFLINCQPFSSFSFWMWTVSMPDELILKRADKNKTNGTNPFFFAKVFHRPHCHLLLLSSLWKMGSFIWPRTLSFWHWISYTPIAVLSLVKVFFFFF